MKEAYVSFEVAKLLKEKGFDWYTYHYYDEVGRTWFEDVLCDWNHRTTPEVSCPTQQMAMRRLREKKGIFVDIRVYSRLPVQFGYDISVLYPDKTLVDKGGTFGFSSYEEATEKGLKYVLQNLSKYL